MVDKVTLANLANLQNETTAVNTVNNNMAAITAAMDNTLSRNGQTPNQMSAPLDMNSNRIVNVGTPANDNDAATVASVNSAIASLTSHPSGSTPSGGSANQVLTKNSGTSFDYSWKNVPTFNWTSVASFGAVGDSSTDNTTAFANALASLSSGGTLYIPPGNYKLLGGMTIPNNVKVVGAGIGATSLTSGNTDVTVVTMSGNPCSIQDVFILGKGASGDTGTFGATQNTLVLNGVGGYISNVWSWGGSTAFFSTPAGSDNLITNLYCNSAYGGSLTSHSGSNFFQHCKFDHSTVSQAITNGPAPYPNWASGTGYTAGQAVNNNSYVMVCTVSGTSGGVAPTLKNYGQNIADNTVTWQLVSPQNFVGMSIGGSAIETRCLQVDLSGSFTQSLQSSGPFVDMCQCIFSNAIQVLAGSTGVHDSAINNVEIAGGQRSTINGNTSVGSISLIADNNVVRFQFANNNLVSGSTVTTSGASDFYIITNNSGVTVTDGASGSHKAVSGNVT